MKNAVFLGCAAALCLAQSVFAQHLYLGGHDRSRPNMDPTEFLPDSLRNLPIKGLCAGTYHHILIKADGTLTGWGSTVDGALRFPPGLRDVKQVASRTMAVALREDGTVVQWGSTFLSHTEPDSLRDIVQISAGDDYAQALRKDGTVAWWGRDGFEVAAPPAGLDRVKAISAGRAHSLALREDGAVVAWGRSSEGGTWIPPELTGVTQISAGYHSWLALAATVPPISIRSPSPRGHAQAGWVRRDAGGATFPDASPGTHSASSASKVSCEGA